MCMLHARIHRYQYSICVHSGVILHPSNLKVSESSAVLGEVFVHLVLRVFVDTHLLWPLSPACAEAPKPHVNSDNGGLGDSGNCCLSVQWRERLSCNGSPVASVCKRLCAAAVWVVPSELHISMLYWLNAWFVWEQFIWRLLPCCQGEYVCLLLHTVAQMNVELHLFIYFHFWLQTFSLKTSKFATFFCDIMTFNNRVSITCFLPADHYICRLWRYITRLVINLPLKTSCPLDCLRGSALINFPFSYGTHAVYSF